MLLGVTPVVLTSSPRSAAARPCRRLQVTCLRTDTAESTLSRRLAEQYLVVQDPARHNTLYKAALKAFANSAVLAYECGYSEDSLRAQLQQEVSQLTSSYPTMQETEITRCLSFLSLVWITIMLSPKRSVVRWSNVSPVGPESMAAWKGFVHMIVIGYYEKRWAWYPIDRLQMELAATNGRTEKPALVAEFAGVVYATLERVAPQFPSR